MTRTAAIPAFLAGMFCLGCPGGARALAAAPAATTGPIISITTATEDGKQMLVATVTRDGKPVENSSVSFTAIRLFGSLLLGEEKPLGDAPAAVPFPTDLPGDSSGMLEITATVQPTGSGVQPL